MDDNFSQASRKSVSFSGGLNDIRTIGLDEFGGHLNTEERRWFTGMDKPSTHIPIPKLNFGFRKNPKTNGTVSEGNTPRGGTVEGGPRSSTPTGFRSAPGSNNTSPNLSRSKSLRVPRNGSSNLKSHSHSSILEQNVDQKNRKESEDYYPVNGQSLETKTVMSFIPRPRSKTLGSRTSISNPNSRSVSPRRTLGDEDEEEEDETDSSGLNQDSLEEISPFQRRTKSFSAKNRGHLINGSVRNPTGSSLTARATSLRRSKTPTSLSTSTRSRNSLGGGVVNGGKSREGAGLARTSSYGLASRHSVGSGGSAGEVQLRERRDSRGNRPLSVYVSEENDTISPRSERANNDGERRGNSLSTGGGIIGRRSHSSVGYSSMDGRSTSPTSLSAVTSNSSASVSSNLSSNAGQSRPKSSRTLSSKNRSSSIEGQSRPSSATAYYQRRGSGGVKDLVLTKQSSTPSSGRSTPVQRTSVGSGSGKDTTDGGVVSSKLATGLPPRTPYRVARTKAAPSSELAGMNELEGSVLLEADDYRRLLNEVKALKTALLKLKRELQDECTSTPAATPYPRVARSRTTPGQTADLSKKLKAAGLEKDAAVEEVAKLKRENKLKSARIESLTKELSKEKEGRAKDAVELQQVTEHRDRLLEKVECLHADKHSLEARLNTLERASMYEQTWSESWTDELDGDESFAEESLQRDPSSTSLGGRGRGLAVEKRGTESDVAESLQSDGGEGESSEPESTAVCSAPII